MSILYQGENKYEISYGIYNNLNISKVYKGDNLIWEFGGGWAQFNDGLSWYPNSIIHYKNSQTIGYRVETNESKRKIYKAGNDYFTKASKVYAPTNLDYYTFHSYLGNSYSSDLINTIIKNFFNDSNMDFNRVKSCSYLYKNLKNLYDTSIIIPPTCENISGICSNCGPYLL